MNLESELSAPHHSARPLQELILSRVSRGSAITLLISVGLIGWFFHRQLHHQTDMILLALAAAEARASHDDLQRRDLQRRSPAPLPPKQTPPHRAPPRSTIVASPWGGSSFIEVFTAVISPQCTLVRHSDGFHLKPSQLISRELCRGEDELFFIMKNDGAELRAARYQTIERGWVIVGIEHAPHDASLWRAVALCALLSLAVWLAVWWITRQATRALTMGLVNLESACRVIDLDAAGDQERSSVELLCIPSMSDEASPRELITLTDTIHALLSRLRRSAQIQRRFIAEAAHELRTPLTGLKGEIEVTLRRPRDAESYRETLSYLAGDVERLIRLSDRLLTTALDQRREVKLEPIQLEAMLHDALEALGLNVWSSDRAETSPETPHISLKTDAPVPIALAERDASLRAIINLIQNALTHAQATEIELKLSAHKECVTLVVSDDGVGLPSALVPHLFTPFARGDQSDGYGLGLSITRDLMRAQGGDVRLINLSAPLDQRAQPLSRPRSHTHLHTPSSTQRAPSQRLVERGVSIELRWRVASLH